LNVPSDAPTVDGLTLAQAASVLQVHPNTVRTWIHEGILKAERIGPRLIRIPHEEIARVRAPVAPRG
jgi:excisionase family DNA binding protein